MTADQTPGRGHGPTGPKRGRAITPHPGAVVHSGPGPDLEPERLGHLADALHAGMLRTPGAQLDRNGLIAAIEPFVRTVDLTDLLSAAAVLVGDGRATTASAGPGQTWTASP